MNYAHAASQRKNALTHQIYLGGNQKIIFVGRHARIKRTLSAASSRSEADQSPTAFVTA
jgi:hypothetical protein